ncbi:MAG: hypothetical protein K2X94_01930 [Amoebophilaceae bacterium]|nr:hypothetical protein [Amoebophilaceae bacterium]
MEPVLRQTLEQVHNSFSGISSDDIKNKLQRLLNDANIAIDATQAGLYLMDSANTMTKIGVLPNESATISLKLSGIDFDEEKSYTLIQIHESIDYANHQFSMVGNGSSSSSLHQGTGDNEGVYAYTADVCIKANISRGFSKVELIKMYIEEKGDFIVEDGIISRGPSKMVGNPTYVVMGDLRSLVALRMNRLSLFGDYVDANDGA